MICKNQENQRWCPTGHWLKYNDLTLLTSGGILSNEKNRLMRENMEKILFCRENISIINFKYENVYTYYTFYSIMLHTDCLDICKIVIFALIW